MIKIHVKKKEHCTTTLFKSPPPSGKKQQKEKQQKKGCTVVVYKCQVCQTLIFLAGCTYPDINCKRKEINKSSRFINEIHLHKIIHTQKKARTA